MTRLTGFLCVAAGVLAAALFGSAPAVAGGSGTGLSASVTAAGHLTSTYQWTVQKSASPASQMVPVGSSATVGYAITTTKSSSGAIDAWLDGKVCVTNTGSADTQGLAISDQLTKPPKTMLSSVAVDVSAMPVLAAGASWCYPFRISVPAASLVAGATYLDSAQVTITNHSGHLGVPTGPTPSTTAALPVTPTAVDGSITVNDSNGQTFNFNSGGTVNYSESFGCAAAAGAQTMVENNTATIASTGQSSSAAATIHCGAPTTVATTLSKETIGQGASVSDQAAISGAAATAGGTVNYYVYSDANCTTQVADATPTDNTVVNGVAPGSKSTPFNDTGSYWWVAVYGGDPSSNTLGSSSDCAAEPLTVEPNDFSISADPSTMTVAQGDPGTSTISTTVVSGSPGTIDLTVSGVPSGATASFDPASITGRGSSTLTVDTGTAAPGTYTLTVSGSAGNVTHSTQLTVTVKLRNDFSISAAPNTVNVTAGDSATSTIATLLTSGSAETIALSVSGLPPGASASFLPTSLTGSGTSTLTINTGTAALGEYVLTVTGTAASSTHTTFISLIITEPQPANDFSISAAPNTVNVTAGDSATSTITTTLTSGSAETAALSVSGLPSGASATFSSTSLTGSGTSTLIIHTGTAAPGNYALTVTGTAPSNTHTTAIALAINPAAGPCSTTSELLTNPGFESSGGWTATAGVLGNSSSGQDTAHSGSGFAWLDGYGMTHTDSLSQTVTIPADACNAVLSFWLHIDTAETTTSTAYDKLTVQIRNSSGAVLETLAVYSNLNHALGYTQKSFDVSTFKGQAVTVSFVGTEDSSLQTSFLIDDTGLIVDG